MPTPTAKIPYETWDFSTNDPEPLVYPTCAAASTARSASTPRSRVKDAKPKTQPERYLHHA